MLGTNRPKLETGGNFEAFPSGKYTLQIADINTSMEAYQNNAPEEKFKFTFFVLTDNKFKGAEGKELTTRGRRLWKSFSKYVSTGANLFKFIKILDPSFPALSVEQKQVYDLDSLIGKQIDALVSKTQSAKDDSVFYNNIDKNFEKCEAELEPIKDLPGKPEINERTSVPVEAPEEPTSETADGFINSLGKENADAKPKTTGKSAEELEIEEEEKALALRKQKIIDNAKSQVKK